MKDEKTISTDKIVTEAKANVDEFVNRTIVNTGIEALKKDRPQLPSEGDSE